MNEPTISPLGSPTAPKTEALLDRMDRKITEWDEEEPREDWWQYQRDYAEARKIIGSDGPTVRDLDELQQAAGALVIATDGMESLGAARARVLNALKAFLSDDAAADEVRQ